MADATTLDAAWKEPAGAGDESNNPHAIAERIAPASVEAVVLSESGSTTRVAGFKAFAPTRSPISEAVAVSIRAPAG
jgi:hypothetical protein